MIRERRKTLRRQADRDLARRVEELERGGGEEGARELRHKRRRAIRHNCRVRIALRIGVSTGNSDVWTVDEHRIEGRILDLSADGCQVFCGHPLDIGQELNLTIELRGNRKVQSRGIVRWTKHVAQHHGYACGVQFAQIAPKDHKHVVAYLKELDETFGL